MTIRLPAFEVLVDMARNDPHGLETLRRSLTNAVITAASNETARQRLRGLQFRIDLECRRAATPLAAAARLSHLMRESLYDLRRALVAPDLGSRDGSAAGHAAQVIPFSASATEPAPMPTPVWTLSMPGSADL
jgi:hypothetical protein